MKIAVIGALEGSLTKLYEEIKTKENDEQIKIDLVLICGNFQAVRSKSDLKCIDQFDCWINSDFDQYYSGKQKANYLTLVIGGQYEVSNYFQTLPYGGWIAPNIYYMGYSNVIKFNGLRIGAISGINDKFYDHIYKTEIAKTGYFEHLPFDSKAKRSVCYTRYLNVYQMLQVKEDLDIIFTFDWPVDVLGDKQNTVECMKKIPYTHSFQNGKLFNDLGSDLYKRVLDDVKPRFWFSGKVRYSLNTIYRHKSSNNEASKKSTHFYSLNKYLPKRTRLEVIDIQTDAIKSNGLEYDFEWLAILKATNKYVTIQEEPNDQLPDLNDSVQDLEEAKKFIRTRFNRNFKIPKNFIRNAPVKSTCLLNKVYDQDPERTKTYVNKQTKSFCDLISIKDPNDLIAKELKLKKTICDKEQNDQKYSASCFHYPSQLANLISTKIKF